MTKLTIVEDDVLYFNWFWEIYTEVVLYKCQRKPKGQSRIDNPEKLATLDTQDTGRRQTKQKTQHNMC